MGVSPGTGTSPGMGVSPGMEVSPTPPSPLSYGVQELDGEKRLAGPGLPRQEPMSVMVMGGPWPGR